VSLILLKIGERPFGVLGLFSVWIQLEIGLVLGDGFIFLLHLLQDLGESEVGSRVLGLDLDCVFGAEICTLVVLVLQIELGDRKIFVNALVVGLNSFDFGKPTMNRGAFRRVACRGGSVPG